MARVLTRTSCRLKMLLKRTYFIFRMTAIILNNPQKRFPESVGNLKERKAIAIKLKELFDGMGLYLDPELIPQDPDYIDTNYNNQNVYSLTLLDASLYHQRYGGNWVYSEATIRGTRTKRIKQSIHLV